jgi:hypothetical protein
MFRRSVRCFLAHKKMIVSGHQWHMLIILAPGEVEIRKIRVQGQLRQIFLKTPHLQK